MRDLTVHAALEHPSAPWGGIGSALGLLLRSAASDGRGVALLHPTSHSSEGTGWQEIRVSVAGVSSSGDVYRSPDRLALGVAVSRQMISTLEKMAVDQHVRVVVHNEELLDLVTYGMSHRNVDVIYYLHGLSVQEHPMSDSLRVLQRRLLATGVVTCVASEAQARLVREHRAASWTGVVPLPLSLLLREVPTPRSDDGATFVAAGRWTPQKGFDLLVRALAGRPRECRCVIYAGHGDSSYESVCRVLSRHLRATVEFGPWLERDALLARLTSARAVIMPSRFEPLGLVAAEAIACGTPVIGTNVGGLGELLVRAGQSLVLGGSDEEKVRSLASLIEDRCTSPGTRVDAASALSWYSTPRTEESLNRAFAQAASGER